MATIRKSKVGKYTYWQIVESKRVNGKPRPVVLAHLGTAEQLLHKLREGVFRKRISSASHGAVFLLWRIAEQLGLKDIFIDGFAPQQRDGLPVGLSLLLAAIHRAVQPGSKRSFSRWARGTTLPELAGFDPDRLDSQHFWDQMDTVTDKQMERVEKAITEKLMEKGLFSPRLLFYDLTNFFTYISSSNEKAKLVQRGRNKQKRVDLRQFGLAQVVTKEFLIPVFSKLYQGNIPDSKMFLPFLTDLRRKMAEINLNIEEITIVFDKGSNSRRNFAELDKMKLPYVASLTPSHHEDLIKIPLSEYRRVRVGEKECLCYRTQKVIWGKKRTVVMYVSDRLREGQIRGLKRSLSSKCEKLQELKTKLNSTRARKRKREDLERQVQSIIAGEHGDRLIKVSIREKTEGRFDIDWEIDSQAYQWVTEFLFGKRILVTCRDEWPEEEIIAAYWGQSNIERVFKHFKNPYHHAVEPQFHWTDHKIVVHTFICVTSLLLSQVLAKKARELGYTYTIENLIDRLSEVRQATIVTVSGMRGKPMKETQLEEMDEELNQLWNSLKEVVI